MKRKKWKKKMAEKNGRKEEENTPAVAANLSKKSSCKYLNVCKLPLNEKKKMKEKIYQMWQHKCKLEGKESAQACVNISTFVNCL